MDCFCLRPSTRHATYYDSETSVDLHDVPTYEGRGVAKVKEKLASGLKNIRIGQNKGLIEKLAAGGKHDADDPSTPRRSTSTWSPFFWRSLSSGPLGSKRSSPSTSGTLARGAAKAPANTGNLQISGAASSITVNSPPQAMVQTRTQLAADGSNTTTILSHGQQDVAEANPLFGCGQEALIQKLSSGSLHHAVKAALTPPGTARPSGSGPHLTSQSSAGTLYRTGMLPRASAELALGTAGPNPYMWSVGIASQVNAEVIELESQYDAEEERASLDYKGSESRHSRLSRGSLVSVKPLNSRILMPPPRLPSVGGTKRGDIAVFAAKVAAYSRMMWGGKSRKDGKKHGVDGASSDGDDSRGRSKRRSPNAGGKAGAGSDIALSSVDREKDSKALLAAINEGSAVAVHRIIAGGYDPNAFLVNACGRTSLALCEAVASNQPEIVAILIAHDASIDKRNGQGVTPLMLAAFHGHAYVASLLLEAGADPTEMVGFSDTSALRVARKRGHHKVAELLRQAMDDATQSGCVETAGDALLMEPPRASSLARSQRSSAILMSESATPPTPHPSMLEDTTRRYMSQSVQPTAVARRRGAVGRGSRRAFALDMARDHTIAMQVLQEAARPRLCEPGVAAADLFVLNSPPLNRANTLVTRGGHEPGDTGAIHHGHRPTTGTNLVSPWGSSHGAGGAFSATSSARSSPFSTAAPSVPALAGDRTSSPRGLLPFSPQPSAGSSVCEKCTWH